MTDTTIRIIQAIKAIPKGKVSSYRDVALAAGIPNGARQTVRVLHSLSEKYDLPWHRVIRSSGNIALQEGEGRELQTSLLRAEGVEVSSSGWVDIGRFGKNKASDISPKSDIIVESVPKLG
jgi:methylated-DNA-protein-cysteine methyltransferase-like protein